ncbi:MAG: hypothetical protein DHS20C16_02260 [Phycisphaerae bacterium]|nr:MAG: hypothetical protein DHS20C16_02260 [Phycisphaerae bacterium]
MIPKGRVDVQILELGAPPRAHELMKKMMAGMSSNSEWYANFVREHAQPGEPLPYDARMGITKEEYDEFLGLNNQLTTVEVGRALLDCKEIAEGRFEFQGGTGLEVLKGIQIDLIKDVLITTNGIGDNRSEVTASEAQSATGPWNGVQWAVRDFDTATMTGVVEKLALGRLSRTGRYILYYNLAKAGSDESNRSSLILTYDLPSN